MAVLRTCAATAPVLTGPVCMGWTDCTGDPKQLVSWVGHDHPTVALNQRRAWGEGGCAMTQLIPKKAESKRVIWNRGVPRHPTGSFGCQHQNPQL